jgi:hypothetical protein
LGTANVNYFKDGNDTAVGLRYISHYDSRAMVFVGTYGMSYQQDMPLKCMGVIFPIDSALQKIDKNMFDFAAAVKMELEWLGAQKVIMLSAETITTIDSALSKASNGGVQYWTHAGTALGYNSWYSYDTLKGNWGGVDGVRGVNGVYGCSVISPGTGLPPQQLGGTWNQVPWSNAAKKAGLGISILQTDRGGIVISFSQPVCQTAQLTVFNCRGIAVRSMRVPGNAQSLFIAPNTRLARGFYKVVIVGEKSATGASFFIVK